MMKQTPTMYMTLNFGCDRMSRLSLVASHQRVSRQRRRVRVLRVLEHAAC